MAEQYWIGDFFIDIPRNQITQNNDSQTIAPKALAVLTFLAENQGSVVSHDALLTKVWPKTVVSPNTLQRSIAQLRKALGDDGKIQSYIKTHAKQGYSLECDVRWHDKISTARATSSEEKANDVLQYRDTGGDKTEKIDSSIPYNKWIAAITLLILLGIVGLNYFSPTETNKLSFGALRSLTTTDNKEFAGIYSPDGEYIVFHRYSEKICMNSNIWAKNIKTQKETQLTKKMSAYGSHSFSQDGKKLVFIESEDCTKPVTQKSCYKLVTLDFEKALESPQSPQLLIECKNSKITRPVWLNNNDVALFQKSSDRWKLTSYSIADNKSKDLYSTEAGNLIYFDYSVADDLIALISIHNDGLHYIEILKPDGEILSSHQIKYPPEIPDLRYIYPNFTPIGEALIFSTGRQLFTLSYQGEVTDISLPLDEPMGSPVFHPNGKRMLVIKGHYDSDIATIPLLQLSRAKAGQRLTTSNESFTILERSTVGEDDAIFQPNGDLMAFQSERSGENQIWVSDGSGSQQLTQFPLDTYINGFDWAADGESILVNANNTLTQISLDSEDNSFTFSHPVEQLFQWNSEDNTALITARIKGVLKFVEYNLTDSEFRIISDKKVNWALKSEDGRLIYTDHLDRFWQPGPVEDQLIGLLENQGSDKRFSIKNNVIYGVNKTYQVWSYDLNQSSFEVLGHVPENIDYLTDINQTQMLLTVRITAKKEVAELSLRE